MNDINVSNCYCDAKDTLFVKCALVKGRVSDCTFVRYHPKTFFFLIISLTIECADHIRSSSLSPVNHRSQKTLSFSLGKSLPKSSNQDRGGLPPIRNEQGRPWCTCCWPVACPPTVEHVHILLQSGPLPPKKITQITYPTF